MKPVVSYIEIGAADANATRTFFTQLFSWQFHLMGAGPEGWFQTSSIKAGVHGNDPSPGILPFFQVPDLEAGVSRVKELGGEAGQVTDEPGFGRFSLCRDPQGVRFGLHQD